MYTTREVPITPQQTKYYNKLKKDAYMEASNEEVTVVNAASMLTKLLQVSAGAVYTDTRQIIEFDITNRLTALKEIMQEASHKIAANVVVFWSPVMSVETYIQCCARIDRAGQKNPMTVVHLLGSPVEHRVYKMLQGKINNHTKLVDLYREELGLS